VDFLRKNPVENDQPNVVDGQPNVANVRELPEGRNRAQTL
jgi:hypothetical protein